MNIEEIARQINQFLAQYGDLGTMQQRYFEHYLAERETLREKFYAELEQAKKTSPFDGLQMYRYGTGL